MFDKIKELVEELDTELDVSKYNDVKDHRKVLKSIRDLAQELRLNLMEKWKATRK